jgi:hypothetical protein
MNIRQFGLKAMLVLVIVASFAQSQTVEAKYTPSQKNATAAPTLGSPANGAVDQALFVSVT